MTAETEEAAGQSSASSRLSPEGGPDPASGRSGWFRNLRGRVGLWILREASSPHGAVGIVALAFGGSAFIPIALEPFLIGLVTNLPSLWRRFAFCFAAGSVLGGVFTYTVGYLFFPTIGLPIIQFWGEEESWARVLELAQSRWWILPVAFVAVGPGSMKLVSMAAGAAHVPFWGFLLVFVVGRIVRFVSIAYCARVFGHRMHVWYTTGHRRYVYLSLAALVAALVGAYAVLRSLLF